jgi:hypothetical protein
VPDAAVGVVGLGLAAVVAAEAAIVVAPYITAPTTPPMSIDPAIAAAATVLRTPFMVSPPSIGNRSRERHVEGWGRSLCAPCEKSVRLPWAAVIRMGRDSVSVDGQYRNGGDGMSFSIERYKEESKKVDTSGIDWQGVKGHSLSKGDLFCLHYMMDIENHVPLYLSHLLVTRACMDPILTAFLACWNYEELWHGENLGKLLNLYGIEFDTQDRIANVRANLGMHNSVSIMATMAGSWLFKDFSAVYLSIGAINELSTLTGYGALIRKSGHPVLKDLLGRIIKDERRHFAFYYNSAKEWLTDNTKAQRVDRWMLERVWVPVGKGVKSQEEVDALALYLFDDEQGQAELLELDTKIGKLPGLSDIKLMSKALDQARERTALNPRWGRRLIDTEAWAVAAPKHSAVDELTTRRLPQEAATI